MTASTYRLTGRIEAGDLAELYKASEDSGGDVVVKLFHPKTSDPAYARALAETSRVLNPLPHTGIVHNVDIGFVKQRLAVVREHVDGYTLGLALQRLNAKEVILTSSLALYLVIQLLETVQKAHEAGVVHGSITPGNLLLSHEGQASICDFGALQALMAVPELKRSFATRGRSAYRAPEVGKGDAPTALSDVYSLGAIAYELLTLREAVVAGGGISTRSGGLPPPSRLDRRINSRLDPIILRAVDPFPNRRFRSAGDFAGALRNFFAAGGGMPGHEDLRRFVRELVPNEVNLSTLGPVPFAEPFTLTPVTGAEIADMRAEPLEVSVVVRTPFTRALSEDEATAETTEAAPRFEEYKPEAWSVPELTQHSTPEAWNAPEPTQLAPPKAEPTQEPTQLASPKAEPTFAATSVDAPRPEAYSPLEPTRVGQPAPVEANEHTEPSRVGPLEKGWEAPSGSAPPKPRKQLVPAGAVSSAKEGTQVGRNPRLKWAQDFSEEKTRIADELQEPPPPQPAKGGTSARAALSATAAPSRPAPSLVRSQASEESAPKGHAPRERPEIPMPPPTAENPVPERRLFTEERNLRAMARRRHKALGLATGIALVGVFAFTVAVWRFRKAPVPPEPPSASKPNSKPIDPRVSAISSAIDQYGTRPQPSKSEPPKPAPSAPEEREEGTDTPRPDSNSAFLTLRTNMPARVFIDGVLQRKHAPLVKYPVKPGNHSFVLESISTKQRTDFSLRFERGQHRVFEQNFDFPLRR